VITVTAVKVTLCQKEQIRGYVTLTIDGSFVIRGIKIIQGADGRLFTAMPSRKRPDGTFQDLAHPACREAREILETAVQAEYSRKIRAQA
jgi:stage V sporulation protein G